MRFGSVCSGIEAASCAWETLGWSAAWLAEIEEFPVRVLHHHYGSGCPHNMPDPHEPGIMHADFESRTLAIKAVSKIPLTPLDGPQRADTFRSALPANLGDMTKIAAMVRDGLVSAPDVLVGGTPCQAFSIAGLRESLQDRRGQLTLSFVELADAIDHARSLRGESPAIIVWENVPGVLNTPDNAFGCFLGALAGEDRPLQPAGERWGNAGCVFGPVRSIAWRVTDAQYFGVAQRRARVFVIASAREGFDPSEILFERDGLRRDSPPSRETGKGFAADVVPCLTGSGRGIERTGESRGLDPVIAVEVICMAHGQGNAEITCERSPTLTCNHEAPIAAYSTSGAGYWKDGIGALRGREQDSHENIVTSTVRDIANTITSNYGKQLDNNDTALGPNVVNHHLESTNQIGAFKAGQGSKAGGIGFDPVLSPTLGAADSGSNRTPVIAFSAKDHGADAMVECSPTLRAGNHDTSHANGGNPPGIAYRVHALNANGMTNQGGNVVLQQCVTGDISHALTAEGHDASEDGTERGTPITYAIQARTEMKSGMAVRRLTPRECERLQSFAENYTLVPVRKISLKRATKIIEMGRSTEITMINGEWWLLAADGPRYKALGNSMCVNNMAWIGQRIQQWVEAQQ